MRPAPLPGRTGQVGCDGLDQAGVGVAGDEHDPAAEEDVEFRRVARETVRSRLGYDSGKLQDIAVDLVSEKITPNWGPNKRDLAVATVLAALSELEDSQ